jgi:hypothetical protein
MTKLEALAFYGGNVSALARALGLDQSTPYSWGEYPPREHQIELERISGGVLKAEPRQFRGKRSPTNHPGERAGDKAGA